MHFCRSHGSCRHSKKNKHRTVEMHRTNKIRLKPGLRVEGAKQLWREALVLQKCHALNFFTKQRIFFFLGVDVSSPRKLKGDFCSAYEICVSATRMPPAKRENAKTRKRKNARIEHVKARKRENTKTRKLNM